MDPLKQRLYGLLRRTERYTHTDMVYLASGGFWLLLAQIVSSGSAFALAITLGNFLSQETYGEYKYILSIAGLLAIFTLPGMGTAISRAVAQGDETSIHRATRVRITWSLLGTGLAFLGAGYYYFVGGNAILALALVIIAATLPFFDTFTLFDSYLVGKRRFADQTKYHALIQIISVPVLIGTAFLTTNLLLLLLAYFVPLLVMRFALYRLILRKVPHTEPADPSTLTYGKHLTAISILGIIASNVDKILLWQFLGPVQVAIYTFALAVPEQLKGPLKGIAELAFPKFAAQSEEQIRDNLGSLKRKMVLYAVFILALSIAYVIAAPYIYRLFFPQYLESVLYSQIFMFSAFALVGTIPLSILSAHKKTKEQYTLSTIQPILQCLAYLILIPFYGILGAIIARVGIRFFYIVYTYQLVKKSFTASSDLR
jgi:O-antigen/teichoic acid export membrane protein